MAGTKQSSKGEKPYRPSSGGIPVGYFPWEEGHVPRGQSIDLNEYPHEILKMKVCRSFRSDIHHKLEIIIRAHGGYGTGGLKRAARTLGVTRHALRRWYLWTNSPRTKNIFERIDNLYEECICSLVRQKLAKRKRKRKKDSAEPTDPGLSGLGPPEAPQADAPGGA